MKKILLLISAIGAVSFSLFLASCDKDNDMCTCTEEGDGMSYTKELDPASYGATNCSDLAIKLNMMRTDGEYHYSCN